MKRIVTLLLVGSSLLLAGAMSACGGGDESTAASASAPAAAAETPTATPKPKATDWPDEGGTPKKAEKAKSSSASSSSSSSSSSSAAAPESVAIKGFAFGPKDLAVKVGQKITWTNQDSAPHTVTSQSGESIDSGTLAQGASFSFTPKQAGTIAYICTIHPTMTATITVQ